MRNKKNKNFSLIEVSLAVGILAVGIITIVTLFPVGVKQSQDAVGGNYSTLCADDIQAYLARSIENSWSFINALPSSKPTNLVSNTDSWVSVSPNIYDLTPSVPGVYGLSMSTGTKNDFAAQANVWTSDIAAINDVNLYDGSSATPDTASLSKGINIEVSWPLNAPMAARTKAKYYFEVYNTTSIGIAQ